MVITQGKHSFNTESYSQKTIKYTQIDNRHEHRNSYSLEHFLNMFKILLIYLNLTIQMFESILTTLFINWPIVYYL